MRVAIDVTTLRGRISGVGYYTARIADHIAQAVGTEISELLLLSNGPVGRALPKNARLVEGFRFPVRSVWMQFLLPVLLRKLQPDLVHYTNYLAPAIDTGPYVLSVHDMSLTRTPEHHTLRKRVLTAGLVPRVARRARAVLTPSRTTSRHVVEDLSISPERVVAIPYAASEAFRPVPEAPRDPRLPFPYLLSVSTIEPRKNLVRLLSAFASVSASFLDVRLVLAGQRGWKCGEIYSRAAAPDLKDRVVFLDYVPEESLPALYTHAVASLYPSLFEGFGFPLVEAMACGSPVLTSNTTALEELATGAALLVDPLDTAAIADGIRRLVSSPAEREQFRARGLERAATLSWTETGRKTLEAYRTALNC